MSSMTNRSKANKQERDLPKWAHPYMLILGMVMSAGIATSGEWNPLHEVSVLAFTASIPATTAGWLALRINRSKTPDSIERRYFTAAYGAFPWIGVTLLSIAGMSISENRWLILGLAAAVALLSIAMLWNLGRATIAMLRHTGRKKPEEAQSPEGEPG